MTNIRVKVDPEQTSEENGCGTVGRPVASDTRESAVQLHFLLIVNCYINVKIKKKSPGNGPFLTNISACFGPLS